MIPFIHSTSLAALQQALLLAADDERGAAAAPTEGDPETARLRVEASSFANSRRKRASGLPEADGGVGRSKPTIFAQQLGA